MARSVGCEHCGRTFEVADGVGRPRKYCRRSCRQRAFEARRHQGDVAWGDARLVELARQLAEVEDGVDRLRATVEELRVDVDDGVEIASSELLERIEAELVGL